MKKLIFILLIIHSSFFIAKAQWQAEVRLTNDPADSRTSFNNAKCIAASGDTVHVIWFDNRNGSNYYRIFYKRSTDGGLTWSLDNPITDRINSMDPCISLNNQFVHVVWENRKVNYEIHYLRSSDGGINWNTETAIVNDSGISIYPSLAVWDRFVHITYNYNNYITYKCSSDGGINWGTKIRLSNNLGDYYAPCISVSDHIVHVVWADNLVLHYCRSTDDGLSWNADTVIINSGFAAFPSISANGHLAHIVWNNTNGICYIRSTNDGISWSLTTVLFPGFDYYDASSVAAFEQGVHVIMSSRMAYDFTSLNYKRSTDAGLSWEPEIYLSNNPSTLPSLTVSNQSVHAVWTDYRDPNEEIYYKQNPTGNAIGIIKIGSEIPEKFGLFQNYPNPFNPATKINFALSNPVKVNIKIYDILGMLVKELVNEYKDAGFYSVTFDGTNLASGVYFYRIEAGKFIQSKKMVLVK